jgi:hypothetical protein
MLSTTAKPMDIWPDIVKKQQPVCPVCAENHRYEECTNKATPKCANCAGNHSASYKKCIKYTEIKRILTRMTETGESFRVARKALAESGNVNRGSGGPDVQGETISATAQPSQAHTYAAAVNTPHTQTSKGESISAPSQPRHAHTYAAAVNTTNKPTSSAHTQTIQIETDNRTAAPVANGTVEEAKEVRTYPSLSRHCSCTAESISNITKFLVLAVQSILQTVQDRELADKLTGSIKKSAEDLLGFTGAETL